jgi:ATP-dependent phosphofructokinase / diphosphate-dependent phosphofructokinase
VKFLLSEPQHEHLRYAGLICVESGHISVLPFDDRHDSSTGRVRVRVVDVHSEHYHDARKYTLHLEWHDLHDVAMAAKLAQVAKMTPKDFAESFATAVTLGQD